MEKKNFEQEHKMMRTKLAQTINILKSQIEIKENLEDKYGLSSQGYTEEERKNIKDNKQKAMKEIITYFELDLKTRELVLDVDLEKLTKSHLLSASRRKNVQNSKSQTMLKAVSKDIDMKVIHEAPFREQSDLVPKADMECQTNMNANLVNHFIGGCFMYEKLAKGIAKIGRSMPENQDDFPHEMSEFTEDFVEQAIEQERKSHMLQHDQKSLQQQVTEYRN